MPQGVRMTLGRAWEMMRTDGLTYASGTVGPPAGEGGALVGAGAGATACTDTRASVIMGVLAAPMGDAAALGAVLLGVVFAVTTTVRVLTVALVEVAGAPGLWRGRRQQQQSGTPSRMRRASSVTHATKNVTWYRKSKAVPAWWRGRGGRGAGWGLDGGWSMQL